MLNCGILCEPDLDLNLTLTIGDFPSGYRLTSQYWDEHPGTILLPSYDEFDGGSGFSHDFLIPYTSTPSDACDSPYPDNVPGGLIDGPTSDSTKYTIERPTVDGPTARWRIGVGGGFGFYFPDITVRITYPGPLGGKTEGELRILGTFVPTPIRKPLCAVGYRWEDIPAVNGDLLVSDLEFIGQRIPLTVPYSLSYSPA